MNYESKRPQMQSEQESLHWISFNLKKIFHQLEKLTQVIEDLPISIPQRNQSSDRSPNQADQDIPF